MKKISLALFGLAFAATTSAYAADSLSVQFDVRDSRGSYTGTQAPAFADGSLGAANNVWNMVNGDKFGRMKLANGQDANLKVDFGRGDWATNCFSGGSTGTPIDIYNTELMKDWNYTTGGAVLGAKVHGLGAGRYRVYALTREWDQLLRLYDVAIGAKLDIAAFPTTGVIAVTAAGTDATTPSVTTWTAGQNYAVQDIAVSDPNHYISILVKPNGAEWGTLQGFQIVDLTPNRPSTPTPADGSTGYVGSSVTLNWVAPTLNPGKSVSRYDVYFGNSFDSVVDSTKTDTTGIFKGSMTNPTTTQFVVNGLAKDTNYYWRVDALFDGDNNGVVSESDPNDFLSSRVWTFQTELTLPIIDTQPKERYGAAGETVTFAITAHDPLSGTLHYVWHQGTPEAITKTYTVDSPNFTFVAEEADLDKTYFCTVSNGNTINTATALLKKKVMLAHWTLDDLTAGAQNSIAGSPATTVVGAPTIVDGVLGKAMNFGNNNGLYSDKGGTYFNELNSLMTITLWIKGNDTADWGPYITKYGENSLGWQVRTKGWPNGGSRQVCFTTRGMTTLTGGDGTNNDDLPMSKTLVVGDNAWHFIAVTFDGEFKKVYVDGIFQNQTSVAAGSKISSTTAPVGIGVRVDEAGAYGAYFNGAVDDVCMYTFPMSAADVANAYAAYGKTICLTPIAGDINKDCKVNMVDLQTLANDWVKCNRYPDCIPIE